MKYPTYGDIDKATQMDICRWYRFLRSPLNKREIVKIREIYNRFLAGGGMTPAISKALGWKEL